MWQCQTYSPGLSKVAMMRVTSPGCICTVSFQPASLAAGSRSAPTTAPPEMPAERHEDMS